MAASGNNMKLKLRVSVVMLLLFIALADQVAARRSGGGRSSSSGSRSRSSSSSRSGSSRVSSPRPTRPWTTSGWKQYGRIGVIYGYTYYTRTQRYRDNPNDEPTICDNQYDYEMSNGTKYNWFICPGQNDAANDTFCCGDELREYCCDAACRSVGALFGIVTGIGFTVACSWYSRKAD